MRMGASERSGREAAGKRSKESREPLSISRRPRPPSESGEEARRHSFTDRQRFPCNAPARVGLPVRRTTIPVAPAASSEQPGLLLRAVPPNYPLTDRLQFDILQSGPGWRGPNVFRSIETARVHHAARQRGGATAARDARAATGKIAPYLGLSPRSAQVSPVAQKRQLRCHSRS